MLIKILKNKSHLSGILLFIVITITIIGLINVLNSSAQSEVNSLVKDKDINSLQKQKLMLEIDNLKLEKSKYLVTGIAVAGSIFIPLLIGIITLNRQQKNALELKMAEDRTAFEIKAAEIVLNSKGSFMAQKRAEVLTKLFHNHLPDNFAKSFDPMQIPGFFTQTEAKLEFLKMVIENMDKKSELIQMWKALFPWDEQWLSKIE